MLPEADLTFEGDFLRWTVVHAVVREALSTVYEAEFIVTHDHRDEDPAAFLGQSVALTFQRGESTTTRRLQGVVRAIEDLGTTGTHRYARLVVVPWLWTLSQRRDSRIFQDMPAVDVVKSVLRAASVYQGVRGALVAPPQLAELPPREYCVQYRETDLDFVMRLLQEEGIPFYFRHDGTGGETLVLAEDGTRWFEPVLLPQGSPVPVSDSFEATASVETVQSFDPSQAMRPTSTTLREFDFTRPRLHPGELTNPSPNTPGPRALYDYPARATLHDYVEQDTPHYTSYDGTRQARIRQQAELVSGRTLRGRGNVTGFAPGQRVRVEGHHADGPNGGHLITAVEHRYQAWSDLPEDVRASERITRSLTTAGVQSGARGMAARYENRFDVIPAAVVYRPARTTPRPLIPGTQTALVVGPANEEIHTDPHGRIKVQFHWDREGVEDEESSCWIRCAQSWAGSGWGFQFIPRIGMEAVVTFLEGDPDRPLVTGCVYNGENRYPYGLPGEKTKSTIKTNSSPTTGGYNELRFEDAAGQEQVYLQAERDHDVYVKNCQSITVEVDRTKVIGGTERNSILVDRVTRVQGEETKEVLGNQDTIVHGESGASVSVDHHYRVSSEDSLTLKVGDSVVVMTPKEIQFQSTVVRIYGENFVDIRGGLVKINCPESQTLASSRRGHAPSLTVYLARIVRSSTRRLGGTDRRAIRKVLASSLSDAVLLSLRKKFEGDAFIANALADFDGSCDQMKDLFGSPEAIAMRSAVKSLLVRGLLLIQCLVDQCRTRGITVDKTPAMLGVFRRIANAYIRRHLSAVKIGAGHGYLAAFESLSLSSMRAVRNFSAG